MGTAFDIHEVFNQAPPFVDVNLFAADRPLRDAVNGNGAHTEIAALERFGEGWGTAHMFEQARLANETRPSCGRSTRMAAGSTSSSSIRPITAS